MSNSKKWLKGRWGQYAQAVKGVKGLHSGGDTTFKDRGPYEEWSNDLLWRLVRSNAMWGILLLDT